MDFVGLCVIEISDGFGWFIEIKSTIDLQRVYGGFLLSYSVFVFSVKDIPLLAGCFVFLRGAVVAVRPTAVLAQSFPFRKR